jgi:hypothetical protein
MGETAEEQYRTLSEFKGYNEFMKGGLRRALIANPHLVEPVKAILDKYHFLGEADFTSKTWITHTRRKMQELKDLVGDRWLTEDRWAFPDLSEEEKERIYGPPIPVPSDLGEAGKLRDDLETELYRYTDFYQRKLRRAVIENPKLARPVEAIYRRYRLNDPNSVTQIPFSDFRLPGGEQKLALLRKVTQELKDVVEGRWKVPDTEAFWNAWMSPSAIIAFVIINFFSSFFYHSDNYLSISIFLASIYIAIGLTAKFAVPHIFNRPGKFWFRALLTLAAFVLCFVLGYIWALFVLCLLILASCISYSIKESMKDGVRKVGKLFRS